MRLNELCMAIMNIVRYTLEVGKELTPEEHTAIASRIDAASKKPYTYDPDCPLLTPEQLAEFRPVHEGATAPVTRS